MYLAIDIILVAVMAAVVIRAAHRGFIRTLFSLLSTVAAILVATCFYKELGTYFYDSFVLETVTPYIRDLAEQLFAGMGNAVDLSALAEQLPEGLISATETLGMDLNELLQQAIDSAGMGAETIAQAADTFAATLALWIANVTAFAALFFGTLILLGIVGFLLDKIAKLPVLKHANKFFGFLLGAVEALVLGIVLAHVAEAILGAYGALHTDFAFTDLSDNTYVVKLLLSIGAR